MANGRIAIMQPYVFPYLGYFQLLNAVDVFVLYDDVAFIKQGWINRNQLLISGEKKRVIFPCKGVSSNKKINEVMIDQENKAYQKLLKSIRLTYSSAPFFSEVYSIVENVIENRQGSIAILAGDSIRSVVDYLELDKRIMVSSTHFGDTASLDRADRLIAIAQRMECQRYINAVGGQELYTKDYFAKQGIELKFIKNHLLPYHQQGEEFVPGLSIVDVLMNNSKGRVKQMLERYELV